jgi:hypothetical protein
MIPTMLVVGLSVGLVPRWWPQNFVVISTLTLLASLAFGVAIAEPVGGTALALANTAVGVALGRLVQRLIPPPADQPTG